MSRRRKGIYGTGVAGLLLLGLLVWNWSALRAHAAVGTAYGARIGCSCRYVEGRDMKSCAADKEPGMGIVHLADVPKEQAVTASIPLLASRSARLKPGWGCLLDPVK